MLPETPAMAVSMRPFSAIMVASQLMPARLAKQDYLHFLPTRTIRPPQTSSGAELQISASCCLSRTSKS